MNHRKPDIQIPLWTKITALAGLFFVYSGTSLPVFAQAWQPYTEGLTYGRCFKFIDASQDVRSRCPVSMQFSVPPPSQKDSRSYRINPLLSAPKVNVIDFAGAEASKRPAYIVGFGFSRYKRLSASKYIFIVDQVITNGANGVASQQENHLPANGTCTFDKLNSQNPSVSCSARGGSKTYAFSFVRDTRMNPPGSNDDTLLRSWGRFVNASARFIDYR